MSVAKLKARKSSTIESVLKVVAYFDLFDYPLTAFEVWQFVDQPLSQEEIISTLIYLQEEEVVKTSQEFWGIGNVEINVCARRKKNQLARERTSAAKKFSQIIASFPYVRAVCLTGSYSKGVMSADSDLDFLIITQPGRLWVSKMLMVLFRKLILLDSHRNFCINYLVSEDNLSITAQNIFTAMELTTMVPAYGHACYHDLMKANKWIDVFFPNRTITNKGMEITLHPVIRTIKLWGEKTSSFKFFNKIDRRFMNLSLRKYRNKYGRDLSTEDFAHAIEVSPQVSKVHPQFFQKIVQIKLEQKMAKLLEEAQIKQL